jgi:hypothetical protein
MKKLLLIVSASICSSIQLFAQYNPKTNSIDDSVSNNPAPNLINGHRSELSNGIPCNPNAFFGINGSGIIQELSLLGNNVTVTGTVVTGGGLSLGYCSNLNSSTFSPTFYSDSDSMYYYNGSSWQCTHITPALNFGGNGNYLYFTNIIPPALYNQKILRYNGTNVFQIYSRPNRIIGVADLAVDDDGNVYFTSMPNTNTFITDSILVISPTGQIIRQFPFTYDFYNAYGSFILNDVFYVALGSANTIHPNSLIPITFGNNNAVAGTPISMPNAGYMDLASCKAGLPLSVRSQIPEEKAVELYPNPTSDETILKLPDNAKCKTILILNILGRSVKQFETRGNSLVIEKDDLVPGIYFISIYIDKNKIETIKLIVN